LENDLKFLRRGLAASYFHIFFTHGLHGRMRTLNFFGDMQKSFKRLALLAAVAVVFSGCTARLIDFTIISSKNHGLRFDLSDSKKTDGASMQFFQIGVNIKSAMDNALENAGTGYDLLVDGVVYSIYYGPLYGGYRVTGTAIRSSDLRAMLGEEGYLEWLRAQNVFDPKTALVQK
jgi:hypothetical protein